MRIIENIEENPKNISSESINKLPEANLSLNAIFQESAQIKNTERIFLRFMICEIEELQIAESLKQISGKFLAADGCITI